MKEYLPTAQIIVSSLLIIFILLQQRGSALGSILGGGGGGFYSTRRGLQKKIFWLTCILAVLFLALAVFNLLA